MYSPETILALENRIGWGKPQDPAFVIELTEANSVGTSGRTFQSFHQLVTVENLYAAMDGGPMDTEDFNDALSSIRREAVLSVVPMIMDIHPDYQVTTDYSTPIGLNVTVFDEAIGYKVAMMVLERFVATTRINFHERNAKLAIGNLKIELEGARSENSGRVMMEGLVHRFRNAVSNASEKMFPSMIIVQKLDLW